MPAPPSCAAREACPTNWLQIASTVAPSLLIMLRLAVQLEHNSGASMLRLSQTCSFILCCRWKPPFRRLQLVSCSGRHLRSHLKCETALPPCTRWGGSLRRNSGGLPCSRAPTGGQYGHASPHHRQTMYESWEQLQIICRHTRQLICTSPRCASSSLVGAGVACLARAVGHCTQ